jgi:hypothetical protein
VKPLIIAAALLAVVSHAKAQQQALGNGAPDSPVVAPISSIRDFNISAGVGNAAATLSRAMSMPGPGGATSTGTLSASLNRAGAARMIAAAVARHPAVTGVAIAAALWDAFRVEPDGSGGLQVDPGQNPVTSQVRMWNNAFSPANTYPHSSPEAAASHDCIAAANNAGRMPGTGNVQNFSKTTSTYSYDCYGISASSGNNLPVQYGRSGGSQLQNQQSCPTITAQGNTVTNPPLGRDGKCPTGDAGPRNPISETAAADVLAADTHASTQNLVPALNDAKNASNMPPLAMEHLSNANLILSPHSYLGPVVTETDLVGGGYKTTETEWEWTTVGGTAIPVPSGTLNGAPVRWDIDRIAPGTSSGTQIGWGVLGQGTTNAFGMAGTWATKTTVTTRDAQGNITSQTTSTTAPGSTTATPPVAVPGNPALPALPTLYAAKYPDGMAGVWADAQAALAATPIAQFVLTLVPSFSDGGCPVWSVPLDVGLRNFGSGDLSVPCAVWAFCRLCIIITAGLLCRRLIFGG